MSSDQQPASDPTIATTPGPTETDGTGKNVSDLPAETIDFANRIFDAAREGNSELLLAAVDAGLPVNLTNTKGNTLLMLAAYAGHADLTKELLKRGADPDRLNDLGQSMIAGAVFKAHDDVVKILVEHGANPRLGTPNAVQAAHVFNRKEIMVLLGTKEEDRDKEVPFNLPTVGPGFGA
ncbi:ankyrin [Pluteus cervinus]|uniref:Ankyrin n=1 Tax=Pluteus cervinus TaxID=181527 RepID=A0ACD3A567_9AGAR|nr:ankyrin [Pluteus cervinus]